MNQPEARPFTNLATASDLRQSETENIIKRLPPMKADSGDAQSFALREGSLPPPRTGNIIETSFPASTNAASETVTVGPLRIERYSPEGNVPFAPELSITFSQPMVALTSQVEGVTNVPVRLNPQPPGRWRWLGTKTLIFQPDGRFPMSTNYVVTVPAGVRSASGSTLEAEKTWSFTTPGLSVKSSYPSNNTNQPRDALMFIEFDQRIDPVAVLRSISVSSGNRVFKTRLATSEEVKQAISKDPSDTTMMNKAVNGRWVAFRAIDPRTGRSDLALPPDSRIRVALLSGAPSAEGRNLSQQSHEFWFKTYGPLRVTDHGCDVEGGCTVYTPFDIEFSNALADDFDSSKIKVEPALPDLETYLNGSTLTINGFKQGNTRYRVTLDKSIKDRFSQTLGRDLAFTFNVGPRPRSFVGPSDDFVVMDPAASAHCSVFSVNYTRLNTRIYSVTPDDWPKWIDYQKGQGTKKFTPPGRLVVSKTIAVRNAPNKIVESVIDLTPALTDGHGQMILIVEPSGGPRSEDDEDEITESWLQVTNIGLDAFVDDTGVVGWVTSLKDGTPLSNVDVTLLPFGVAARSGSDGLARLALKPSISTQQSLIVARRDDGDVAVLPEPMPYSKDQTGTWGRIKKSDSLRWFVFDDRKMYQPREEVHIKGWIRRISGDKTGDTNLARDAVTDVSYYLKDARGNMIKAGTVQLNALGGFDFSLKLPDRLNLGPTTVELQALSPLAGNTYSHRFEVQEFRRPEFEVKTHTESEGPFFVRAGAELSLSANYYAGGALPNAPVKWSVIATTTQFTPPNRGDYAFGEWVPWWSGRSSGSTTWHDLRGVTDASGKHRLHIDFDRVNPARPSTVTAFATVSDVNRQEWKSQTTLLVHPANLYVGLKSDKMFVEQGQPLKVQAIVTDLDGNLVEQRAIKIVATRLSWKQQKDEWEEVETDPQECLIRSAASAVTCTFEPKVGGEYRVKATIRDDRERPNESALTIWVSGAEAPPNRDVDEDEVQLIPNQKDYRAGDTAEILVQAPFYPAEGVLRVQRSGIVMIERFHMDQSTTILRVPIEKGWTPNVHLQVDLLGETEREDSGSEAKRLPKQPAYATGTMKLSIPPFDRRLSIVATPREKALEPGGETTVSVDVRDASGTPVAGGEVAVVVVDEAILALTDYKLDDPVSVFYPERNADVEDAHLRANVWLATPGVLDAVGSGGGAGGGEGGGRARGFPDVPALARGMMSTDSMVMANAPPSVSALSGGAAPIRIRQDFNPLAVFAPSLPTDVNGRAEVKVKLPDNLTRYRVMAVAVAGGKQFGSGESSITARMPLMVRASAPRFLNFGDVCEFPIVVQNQTDATMSVDVALRASNARLPEVNGPSLALSGRRVTVPANDRVELRIPVATATAGTARFQIAAVSGAWADATEVSLPVWSPATTEAFATYGVIDEGAISQPVSAPAGVFKEFGGLEIEGSSTQLQELTDAFLYLQTYPYECSEQLASRILSIAALRDVLHAFNSKGLPSQAEIHASVVRDIKRLEGMQNSDGGFGFWKRGEESWPFLSIHVAHALARARQQKFTVPVTMYDQAREYLRAIELRIPSRYGIDARRALIAYALYVRAQMGDRDTSKARKLLSDLRIENLSLETVGWLLSVLSGDENSRDELEALRRNLKNRVSETAGTAHFVSGYDDDNHLLLNSDRRADAVVLDALIADQPANDLIPKIVRGLLAHRTQGRWSNTQENVFVLLALERYFKTYEKVTPDFIARVWLGNAYAGEHTFKGRSVGRQKVNVPMRYLVDSGSAQNLLISKGGEGRLYYRLAMSYAPFDTKISSADYGFTVERTYEAMDHPDDVRRDADGEWHIKAGARVRVRVTMAAPSRRYHVALVDYLPAGLESLNPELAVTGNIPEDKKQEPSSSFISSANGLNWWLWRSVWFDHQNLREERSEAFTTLLWGGVYNYSYVARATTPGSFVVPPAKAEEMYHPETFGRSKSDRVRVE
ncbi:MAG TPA: Ig-like domain-containing protein [Pyrinomonadaceae bacterium]|nr:Ig-like domain-containing protein [Pyrinomonadaceae bacterium]